MLVADLLTAIRFGRDVELTPQQNTTKTMLLSGYRRSFNGDF